MPKNKNKHSSKLTSPPAFRTQIGLESRRQRDATTNPTIARGVSDINTGISNLRASPVARASTTANTSTGHTPARMGGVEESKESVIDPGTPTQPDPGEPSPHQVTAPTREQPPDPFDGDDDDDPFDEFVNPMHRGALWFCF